MDISVELKGLPCLNKVYLLTYLLITKSSFSGKHVVLCHDDFLQIKL